MARLPSLAVAVLLSATALPTSAATLRWKSLDVDGNGRFDRADIASITKGGVGSPSLDVDGNGQKDVRDSLALPVFITRYDRTGDLAVSDDDFGPARPIEIPAPDARAAARLTSELLQQARSRVRPELEKDLVATFAPVKAAGQPPAQAALFEQAGASALVLRNLDEAQLCFARAATLDPRRDSSLANLGFVMASSGRYTEALVLLSQARSLNPGSCTTIGNIAFVLARSGKDVEARGLYAQAVGLCPKSPLLHINLAAVLLRLGQDRNAQAEFAAAASLSPGDVDALLMSTALAPVSPPGDLAGFESEYEQKRLRHGDSEWQTWREMSVEGRISEVRQQLAERATKDQEAAIKALKEELRERARKIAEPALAKGQSACEDMKRCLEKRDEVFRRLQLLKLEVRRTVTNVQAVFDRQAAAAQLNADSLILQIAVSEAQRQSASVRNGRDARRVFERTVDRYYTRPIREILDSLRKRRTSPDFDIWDTSAEQAVTLCFMPPMAALKQGYSDWDTCGAKPRGDQLKFSYGLQEAKLGISLAIVGLEWKPDKNEWKLQVGQGVLVAGTWSPASGFGFQLGTGIDVTEGALTLEAATWVKWGSDGSINVEGEGGAGIGGDTLGTGLDASVSKQVRAATHEPIGTL